MRVGPAGPKPADPSSASLGTARPRQRLSVHEERTGRQLKVRGRLLEVEGRRNQLPLKRQGCLDKAGDSGGGSQVADAALDGTQGAELLPIGLGAKGAVQRRELDGVAELRTGAMRFDKRDGIRLDTCHRLGEAQHLHLAVDTGRGVAGLRRPIVIHRGAADYRADAVAISYRVLQPLKHDYSDAAAADQAIGLLIKGATVSAAR